MNNGSTPRQGDVLPSVVPIAVHGAALVGDDPGGPRVVDHRECARASRTPLGRLKDRACRDRDPAVHRDRFPPDEWTRTAPPVGGQGRLTWELLNLDLRGRERSVELLVETSRPHLQTQVALLNRVSGARTPRDPCCEQPSDGTDW